ncbi:MAG: GNAT family N-acetyltransferase [Asgard group archaeon]|nr:GNAT family N-acetyltransferase [Asgard group archaeon]
MSPMTHKDEIIFYQELAIHAFPPKEIIPLNGWLIRIDEGRYQRPNSVVPLVYQGSDLESDIHKVEEIYSNRNLQTLFQVADYYQPQTLWEKLLELKYEIHAETQVMRGKVDEMVHLPFSQDFSYTHSTKISSEWFDSLQAFNSTSNERMEIVKKIIERIKEQRIFFYAKDNEEIVGVCLAVIERNCLGIYSMAVKPDYRRRGIGLSLIAQTSIFAKEQQLENIYLQVQGDNYKAIALYEKAKMKEIYKYRYFIK